MPAWSALLAWGLGLSPELAVGLILVACCPGGTASNVVVFLAKSKGGSFGKFNSLFHSNRGCINTLAHFFVRGHYIPIEPWALLKSILWIVLFPLAAGIILKGFFPAPVKKVSEFSPVLSVLFILLIVGYILASKRDTILENGWILLLATGLLHLGGFF